MKTLLIVLENYVINRIVISEEEFDGYVYPYAHDLVIEDANTNIHIGDWYEASEGLFYRPIGVPPDWPTQLIPTTENQE